MPGIPHPAMLDAEHPELAIRVALHDEVFPVGGEGHPAAVAARRAFEPGGLAGGTGLRYLTFAVSNMDEVHAACTAAGATVTRAPFTFLPGTRIAMYEDPDGNAVELLERTD